MIALAQLSESRIREATSEVFARAHFTRQRSWFDGWEIPLPDWSPRVWWTLLAITLCIMAIAAIAQRIPQGGYRGARGGPAGPRGVAQDGWLRAQTLAANGDYAAALHALFAALVITLGRAQEVDPHPAKTVGDYARELAARRSAMAAPYLRFAEHYERALYAGSQPDRSAYESLVALAQPLGAPPWPAQ